MKGRVVCGSTYMWYRWLDLSLKVTSNHQSGTQRDTGYRATQLTKKGLSFVTQDSRIDSEVVWKLITVE